MQLQGHGAAVGQVVKLRLGFVQVKFIAVLPRNHLIGAEVHAGLPGFYPGFLPDGIQIQVLGGLNLDRAVVVNGKGLVFIGIQNLRIQVVRVNLNPGKAPCQKDALAGGILPEAFGADIRGRTLYLVGALLVERLQLGGIVLSGTAQVAFIQVEVVHKGKLGGSIAAVPDQGVGSLCGLRRVKMYTGILWGEGQAGGGILPGAVQNGLQLREGDHQGGVRAAGAVGIRQGLFGSPLA